MLQDRERVVLEVLQKIPKRNVVLIGGYAVNAYVPPRFSIDCDIVMLGSTKAVELILKRNGFTRTEAGDVPQGSYLRYFRNEEKVSFDLLVNAVFDRNSGIVFEGKLFTKYSRRRVTVGRANPIRIEMRIANPEILFATKFVTARRQDIRDIFMLAGEHLDWEMVADLIRRKCDSKLIRERIEMIRQSIESKAYRDSLHGPFGMIPDGRFNSCKDRLFDLLSMLQQ